MDQAVLEPRFYNDDIIMLLLPHYAQDGERCLMPMILLLLSMSQLLPTIDDGNANDERAAAAAAAGKARLNGCFVVVIAVVE